MQAVYTITRGSKRVRHVTHVMRLTAVYTATDTLNIQSFNGIYWNTRLSLYATKIYASAVLQLFAAKYQREKTAQLVD